MSESSPVRQARTRALAALALLVPAPTIGVVAAMLWWPGSGGQSVFVVSKLWILALPMAWLVLVEGERPGWSPPRRGGLGVGALLGVATAVVIWTAYLVLAAGRLDAAPLRETVVAIGLDSQRAYLAGAAYWIFVNSVVEEYVWRWFAYRQCERVLPPVPAVAAAAAAFTIHHVVALSVYLAPVWVVLASCGVFAGGVVWSWCYQRYRSIWPGWLAHAGADVAVFAVGWHLVF